MDTISFHTASGRRLNLLNLRPEDILVSDLARGLALTGRFANQLPGDRPQIYTVAQHSCLVDRLLGSLLLRRHALLHDAEEAFLGDMSGPLKHHPMLADYRNLAQRVREVIWESCHLPPLGPFQALRMKAADLLATAYEEITLRRRGPFQPDHISQLLQEGFLGSDVSFDHLMQMNFMLPSLPDPDRFRRWPSVEAEGYWMKSYVCASPLS